MKALSIALITSSIISLSWISKPSATTSISAGKKIETKITSGERFSFFRAHRQGKGVTATWGVTNSNGITDFVVEQTYEDPTDPYANWTEVANPSCVGDRSYKHTDAVCFPGFINYRVVAMNGLTVVDVSNVETVHIVQH